MMTIKTFETPGVMEWEILFIRFVVVAFFILNSLMNLVNQWFHLRDLEEGRILNISVDRLIQVSFD